MANKFDRIIQENFKTLTLSLMHQIMDIQEAEIIHLPRKIQRTLEREMDNLLKFTTKSGNRGLLNMEWQAGNDPKMNFRMLLYHAISSIVYELPVMGVVIYIGKDELAMPAVIESDNLRYNYRIIDFTVLNPESFLQSDIPEEIIMAVLAGKTRHEEKREIINKILFKLRLLLGSDKGELDRRIAQLEIIGELRNVQKIIVEEEQKMAITFNIENDIRYNQGLERGLQKGLEEVAERNAAFVTYLLQHTSHSSKEIAKLANVSVAFVQDIRKNKNL